MAHLAPTVTRTDRWVDILERSFWTAFESTTTVLVVDQWYQLPEDISLQVVVITTGLAFLRNVGKHRTALWKS